MDKLRKHPLLGFLVLNYIITWAIAFPLVATAQGWFGISAPFSLHYLTAYGPLLASIIMVWAVRGGGGLRQLFRQVVKWRVKPIWYLVALSPIAFFILVALVTVILGGAFPDPRLLGNLNYLPYIGLVGVLVFWILNSGLGEEVGWRGYLLPLLQEKRSPLVASLIVALFWIIWHFPFFFYLGTYVELGFIVLPGFALGIVSGSIVLAWLFNNTKGSVLMAILFHGTLNLVTAAQAEELANISIIVSILIVVWAVFLVIFRPTGLRRQDVVTQPLSS